MMNKRNSKKEIANHGRQAKRLSGRKKTEVVGIYASVLAILFTVSLYDTRAFGADLILSLSGRVTVEFVSSSADFINTLLVIPDKPARIAQVWDDVIGPMTATTCNVGPIKGVSGIRLFTAKNSDRHCKVDLHHIAVPDIVNTGQTIVNSFPPNTRFEFILCVQATAAPDCTYKWSSNPAKNKDVGHPLGGVEHVLITETIP